MVRYEGDGSATVVASWGQLAAALPVGTRVSLEGRLCGLAATDGRAFRGRRSDRRGRAALGSDEHRVASPRSDPGGHRGADGVLSHGGLRAGVEAVASRMPVPVELGVSVGRLPAAAEATAYFVVAEALTNVAKHSRATRAEATARVEDDKLRVLVRDDGVGGARPEGSGLVGLGDRLAALDGRLRVESPPGGGTLVAADIPLPA
jgi:hypothetical protein